MQGANRQISKRRPPNRRNSACIGKAKSANSRSNVFHETPRAHLRFRCDPAPWLQPLMVRTYIRKATARQRKGGHGGDRSKAGLPAGDWQEKGGRALAPQQPPQRLQQKQKNCCGSEAPGQEAPMCPQHLQEVLDFLSFF